MRRLLLTALLTAILLSFANPAFSQEKTGTTSDSAYTSVVLLTSGGTLTGRIVEDIPGDKLILERRDGKQFDIPYDKIAAVSRNGELSKQQLKHIRDSLRIVPTHRMQPRVQAHIGVSGDANQKFVGFQTAGGAMIAPDIFLGAGVGYELDSDNESSFLPIYVEGQYLVGQEDFAMMFYGRGGYSFGWLEGYDGSDHGGVRFEAGFGILRTFSEDRNGMFVQIGYLSQTVSGLLDLGTLQTRDETRSEIKVSFGVAF